MPTDLEVCSGACVGLRGVGMGETHCISQMRESADATEPVPRRRCGACCCGAKWGRRA